MRLGCEGDCVLSLEILGTWGLLRINEDYDRALFFFLFTNALFYLTFS
jgi:hypothetical protein